MTVHALHHDPRAAPEFQARLSAPRPIGVLASVIFVFEGFELDEERLELRRGGAPLPTNPLLVRLLLALVRDAGQLVTKDELVERVWAGRPVADNVITVSMARLRQLLGRSPAAASLVVTVYGRGYRFAGEVAVRSAGAGSGPAPRATELAPPFVGRQRVLERLRSALAAARDGRGRLCALLGEPGIGKTRAVEMLEREAGASVRVAWGYCRQAGDTPPLWPWLRLLREIVVETDVTQAELERALGPLGAELRALMDEPGATLHALPSEGAVDPRRHHVFDAVLRTLALAAERGPRLLVLDDLHGADAASIELLGLLLDQLAHLPILVVATLRTGSGGAPPRPETQLPLVLGHRNCEAILLERLSAEEVAEYVAAVAGDVGGTLGRAVFAKSEGNPFFMVELSRGLPDAERSAGDALAVSKTALELLRQRLAQLGTETREVLSAAAVIGRSFELSLLAAVTDRAPDALIVSLDEALAADVVVAAKDSTTAFEFGHELLRAALYDAQSPAEQRRWHLGIGAALERRASAGEDVPAAELAYHFHAALPEGDLRKTIDHCRRAAAAAIAVAANPDVVRYARRALQALDLMPNPSLRLRGQLLYMLALFARGDGVEFPRAITKVIRLAREQGDGPLLVSAAAMLNPHRGVAALPGATEALEHALTLLHRGERAHDASRAVALAGLALAPPRCYAAELSEPLVDEAISVARTSGGATALRVALESKLYLRGGPAYRDASRALASEVQQLASQNRRVMPVVPITLALHEALVALQRGELAAAGASIDEAVARARELRHGELRWHGERARVLLSMQQGGASDGVAELQALHRRAEQRPVLGTAVYCAFDRLVALPELAGMALPVPIDAATRKALEPDGSEPPSVWSLQVRALAAAGLMGEARAALRAVAPVDLAKLPCDTSYLGTLGHLARAALRLNELEHVEALHALLARFPNDLAVHESIACEGAVPHLLGLLARALGRQAEARTQLEAGLAMNERVGLTVRAAEARAALAELGPASRRA